MTKIVDWYTVGQSSYENFDNAIIKRLSNGFQPYGNFILLPTGERNKYLLMQPMVKYEADISPKVVDWYTVGQTNYDAFDNDVMKKLNQGFQPFGNSVIMPNPNPNGSNDWILMQVMVKYDN